MMLQLLFLVAFAIVSFLAARFMIGNLLTLSRSQTSPPRRKPQNVHPELLDEDGNLTDEPLWVLRTDDIESVRTRLDALYRGESPDDDLQNV
ncbi:MAG: DUF2973 domain-containing protein [Cyanobacteria bacterium J06648_11]